MKPIYISDFESDKDKQIFNHLLNLNWLEVTPARKEYFMADQVLTYTYSNRSYTSNLFTDSVENILSKLNKEFDTQYNVCFLNRYDNFKKALGRHSDDSPEMNHKHPICSLSFGAEREIWWAEKDFKGVIPKENRQLLENGSLFIMPAGFQQKYFHQIPRCDHECGIRISLTFRNYLI